MQTSHKRASVYTDGSTSARSTKPNSGASIHVTDEADTDIWSGGLVVRTDGNNFIAELAAAAIVVKACPPEFPITIRIDSKAAIGAITKGPVSERKRVCAAGRAWLNFCRKDFSSKNDHIKIEHVRSHIGLNNPEQRGNDKADELAKIFRNLGDTRGPALYFTHAEEKFLFSHNGKIVQSNIRSYLKSVVEKKMIEYLKVAPRQAEFFLAYPIQIRKQTRKAWKWAVENRDGRIWLYFIFGVLQRLPTQYCVNRHRNTEERFCLLCQSTEVENMDHLWTCPAMAKEQMEVQSAINTILQEIPLGNYAEPRQASLCRDWLRQAKALPHLNTSNVKLGTLVEDFWNKNKNKEFISKTAFVDALNSVVDNATKQSKEILCSDLLSILQAEFCLQVEACTNALCRSNLFAMWCSEHKDDQHFGALGSLLSVNFSGRNTFAFPPPNNSPNCHGP